MTGPMRRTWIGPGRRGGTDGPSPEVLSTAATLLSVHQAQQRAARRPSLPAQVRSAIWRARRMAMPLVAIAGVLAAGILTRALGELAEPGWWVPATVAVAVVALVAFSCRRRPLRLDRAVAAGVAIGYLAVVLAGA